MPNTGDIDINLFNSAQRQAYDAIMSGETVFVTGSAGTGKSALIRAVTRDLRAQGKNVVVCAPTGIAAQNIGGMTVHAAFRYSKGPAITKGGTGKKPRLEHKTSEAITYCDSVIIDEVSMLRMDYMDSILLSLDIAAEKSGIPKQLILIGDFRQLPPVVKGEDADIIRQYYAVTGCPEHPYPFLGVLWQKVFYRKEQYIRLTEVCRTDDKEFAENQFLASIGDSSCLEYFNKRVNAPVANAINLMGKRDVVKLINEQAIARLDKDAPIFDPVIKFKDEYLKKRHGHKPHLGDDPTSDLPEPLTITEHMPVLMTMNKRMGRGDILLLDSSPQLCPDDILYINGDFGVVEHVGRDELQIKIHNRGLRTVHREDYPIYDLYSVKEDGRTVVKQIQVGTASQFPILPRYAMTIHKAQGQSYDAVNLDPDNFAPGQVYVGLSRARTFEGLSLTRPLTADDLKTDPLVEDFYKQVFGSP